ncbi:MAG: hypothetical protein C0617_12285 [Desulfuromonas sp.]|uniref:ATP synthase F0 subunit B n=1 Tax=Desulfuromonas sp. TaxID=892 RepID=UPI000CC79507|nr:ATP synthase F0 subunit B [Desulfuromonas sp.]PLX83301.1 MAG: hypothetical protein C0617_12285 [Desulfuromonas sp.]
MINLDWTLLLQFFNFFLLMAILHFVLYRPLRAIMSQRQQTMDGSYQKAKDLEAQVAEKMDRYQAQLQEAKQKGSRERAQLRQGAAKEESVIIGAAREKAADQLQVIKSKVAAEAQGARKALRSESETLAAQVASKVLGRKL